jgi:hypothetical protein
MMNKTKSTPQPNPASPHRLPDPKGIISVKTGDSACGGTQVTEPTPVTEGQSQ